MPPTSFSARFDAALSFAAVAHRTQTRKGSSEPAVPYIIHPVHVATILIRHGFPEDLAIAALLHDTVEDTEVELSAIATRFGATVAALVDAVTEKKTESSGERRPWRVRKQEQLDHLAASSPDVAALKAADALHNASCTCVDLERDGTVVWTRFNAGPTDTVWYYREIVRAVSAQLGGAHPLVEELSASVERLAKHVG